MRYTMINTAPGTEKAALRAENQPGEQDAAAAPAGRAAAGRPPLPAAAREPLAPALEAAARDLYLALRTLAASPPGPPQPDPADPVPGLIRQAADATGAAWQCLTGGYPSSAAAAISGPGTAVRQAARRVAAASSQPAATAPGRDEIAAMAMVTAHAMAATAGYLAWASSGLRASRLRNAQDFLDAAGEHLSAAIDYSQALSRARRIQARTRRADGEDEPGRPALGRPRAASAQAATVPLPAAGNRTSQHEMRLEMPRRKRLAYRIRELLAGGAWPRKRSA